MTGTQPFPEKPPAVSTQAASLSPIHGREYPGRNSRQDQARTDPGAISFTHSYPERKRKFLISRERHYFTCGERQQTRNHITHTSTSQGKRKEKRTRHHSIHREELSPKRRIQARGKPQDNHLYNICKSTYRQREESRFLVVVEVCFMGSVALDNEVGLFGSLAGRGGYCLGVG